MVNVEFYNSCNITYSNNNKKAGAKVNGKT
jgi:hypothetical protein